MNIYILEDDLMQQTRISDIIRELVSEGAFSVRKLEVFSKPHKLLSSINEKGNHQIFLLDIDIDGNRKKGLEVASEIRQQDANAVIIFVTTHSEFAPISFKYKVSALDFIEKTVSNVEFKQQLKQTLTTSVNKILFSCHRSFLVNLDNIARIDKTQLMIYFENGDSCPVSRLKMKALLKKWSEVRNH